jgi:hypothetical protein
VDYDPTVSRKEICVSKESRLYPVFYRNRSALGKPLFSLRYPEVMALIEAGQAEFMSAKQKAVWLTKTEGEIAPTARSLRMGLSVIHGCAEGNRKDLALLESWKPRTA